MVLAVGLVVGSWTGQALAQGKKVEFSLNAGRDDRSRGATARSAEALFTFAPQVDIHVYDGVR
ncbi:MAG: hypothetical protein M0C28_24175 [Candidatus Moduliflexus flocculans]|nr:hypothetical protein [Candidatus Moduliflexus flocculans]